MVDGGGAGVQVVVVQPVGRELAAPRVLPGAPRGVHLGRKGRVRCGRMGLLEIHIHFASEATDVLQRRV